MKTEEHQPENSTMAEPTAIQATRYPIAYFPPIAYMASLVAQSDAVLELHETFPKQTLRNRTVIVTANGPMTLSVPVVRTNGNHTISGDIEIAYTERWNTLHLRAIETAYNSSPFYLYYCDKIIDILNRRYQYLWELDEACLLFLLKALKADVAINYSTDYLAAENTPSDHRGDFSYKHPDETIVFPEYQQVFADRMDFNPNVSCLDLLFNLGPEASDYLRLLAAKNHGL